MVRQFVSRECPVTKDLDVLTVLVDVLILGESSVHHGIPRDVVAPVGVDEVLQSNIMEAREEVESVPGTLGGSLLPRTNREHSGVLQGGF